MELGPTAQCLIRHPEVLARLFAREPRGMNGPRRCRRRPSRLPGQEAGERLRVTGREVCTASRSPAMQSGRVDTGVWRPTLAPFRGELRKGAESSPIPRAKASAPAPDGMPRKPFEPDPGHAGEGTGQLFHADVGLP